MSAVMFTLQQLPTWIWIFGALIFLPGVTALSDKAVFPDLPFKVFSKFIRENFAAEITLSQVLLVLFTLTENPDLLNLHARQKNPKYEGETRSSLSGWIKCLARRLEEKLGQEKDKLFYNKNIGTMSEDETIKGISRKIDAMANVLHLYSYNSQGHFKEKLKQISYSSSTLHSPTSPIGVRSDSEQSKLSPIRIRVQSELSPIRVRAQSEQNPIRI